MSCTNPQFLSSRLLFRSSTPQICSRSSVRHESTARRLTKRLRVPPSTSYANEDVSHDHIIFNPPSSAPNVYHTPLIFMPKSDKRRKLLEASAAASASLSTAAQGVAPAGAIAQTGTALSTASTPITNSATLPPPLRPIRQKKYHVTAEQIDEIRALRAEDPRKWTRGTLAKKYGCSEFFIGLVSRAPEEVREEQRAQLDEIKKKWGRRKREAREDRTRRKETWGMDS